MRKSWLVTQSLALALAVAGAGLLAAAPAEAANDALKGLMKKMGAQVAGGDAKSLAPIFEQTKALGRPEFGEWGAISDRGKAAAAKGDLDGAKATCKDCHDKYRGAYKAKYGSKAP